MATVSRNPWDTDPVAPTQAPWASDPVVTSAKNPWDTDPVAAPAARTPTTQPPASPEANVKKFLDFLGRAEGADYNTIVGGSKFSDFRAHPRVVGLRTAEGPSTAAGKYQIVGTTYDDIAPKIGVRDFSPDSQDKIALELIRRKGALEDIRNGNFDAAVGKLGGIWASLPSSPYSQPKRSAEWVAKELGAPTTVQYQNFAAVRKDIEPQSLNKDVDWLRASELLYNFYERKPFQGTKDDLAEWGKDSLGNFNFNLVSMAEIAYSLQSATQEEKEAFLFMMDTYDNTNFSLEGAGRAVKGIATDPTNLVGLGTLGVGFLGKFAGKQAAKAGIRKLVLDSLARTGIGAGIQSGVVGAADSTIRQGIEVSAGRREEIDLSKVGVDAAIAGTAGVILGTAADAAVTKVVGVIKGRKAVDTPTVPGEAPKASASPDPNVAGVTPQGEVKASSGLSPAEEAGLIQRQQDGRLPADEIVPNVGADVPKTGIPELDGVVYHGSNTQFDVPNMDLAGKTSGIAEEGRVFWVTSDKQSAEGFGKLAGDAPVINEMRVEPKNPVVVEITARDIISGEYADIKVRELDKARAAGNDVVVFKQKDTGGMKLISDEIAVLDERAVKPASAGKAPPKIDVPQANTGLRTTRLTDEPVAPLSKAELSQQADVVVTQLRDVETKDLPAVLETLRTRSDLSREEIRVVDKAVQNYKNEVVVELATLRKERMALDAKTALSEPEVIRQQELVARIEDLEARVGSAQLADDATGSMAGSILQDRQDPMNALKGVTVESIMAEKGITKLEAEQVWAEMVGKANLQSEAQKIATVYDDVAAKALDNGDLEGAMKASILKNRELDAKIEALAPKGASFVDKLTEFAISNVFSIKTIIINLIPSGMKTLVIPGLKAILNNPFEKATRAEAAASYSAMRSSFGAALNAAKAGFRYEQALLSRDGTRLVEGEMALTGKLGGAWRIFPRILNASDEFLSRLNYDSFVAGKAAAEAAMEGAEKGLKGKALDDFISEASKKALDASMKPTSGDELVQPIINKGLNLGLTGEDLFKYVEREAMRDPQSLRKGNDEEALNFLRDVLYKRKFSGEGSMSKAAQAYEDAMKKFPTLKLVIGQLFFRTPIRVFEEGIRLTPGLQFVAPNFMKDLAGANGSLRQVRAQAEAMTSLVIASGVLSLYAQGRIQGDGAYDDYKQQKNRTDGPLPEPYTIKMSDGSTWSYRGFDPLATPVKIMVNALNRMDQLRLREAQGEFVDKEAYKPLLAAVTVGSMSIASAIRDASLVEGADNFAKFVKTAFNPEEGESAFIKALGDKLFLLVPNTLHKIARDNDPQIRDPQTFWQMVEQKLLRPVGLDDPAKTAFAYDVLGNTRKMSDTGSLWNVFSTASVEERAKGMNEKEQFILTEMDRLSRVTGVTFKPPVKAKEMGDADMRTIMAADGKRTLYDVWQQNYKSLKPEDVLYPILKAPLPEGTFKYRAAKVEETQAVINELQSAAMAMTMQQEQKVVDKYISTELLKAKSKAGLFDTPRPY
jgi:muramidase (phage lysozyme)